MVESKTSWVNMKPEEIEKHVIDLAQKGVPPEQIGLVLRDQHGIPKVRLFGIKIKKILKKSKMWVDSEENARKKKTEKLQKHAAAHKHDYTAQRSLMRQGARAHSLSKKR